MKVKMTHNEYVEFLKENASRLYDGSGYSMADYNRDADNVEVLPFDLSRFSLAFSEEQLKVINLYFTEESVNQLGHMLLKGHMMNSSEHAVANTLGIDIVADKCYSGFGKNDENRCVFEFCEGDIYLVLCENMKEYHEELESHYKFYEVEDRLPDLVFVDNRKGAYLYGGDDPGFDEYDVASSPRKLTLSSVETAVSAWLSGFQKEGVFAAVTGLDINSDDYKEMLALVESLCEQEFPELRSAVFGDDAGAIDLFFRDKNVSEAFNVYYYNPDSVAGGQVVQCPFDKDDVPEMMRCGYADYFDVLAKHTQYLSDVDTEHFFNTIFELIQLKQDGFYLGSDMYEVCRCVVGEKSGVSQVDIQQRIFESFQEGRSTFELSGWEGGNVIVSCDCDLFTNRKFHFSTEESKFFYDMEQDGLTPAHEHIAEKLALYVMAGELQLEACSDVQKYSLEHTLADAKAKSSEQSVPKEDSITKQNELVW